MSEYRKLVERLATLQGHEYRGAYNCYGHVGNDLQLLVEMADKAEKYEMLTVTYANICKKCKMRDKAKCKHYGGTISLDILVQCLRDDNAFDIFSLRDENKILKDGIKAIQNTLQMKLIRNGCSTEQYDLELVNLGASCCFENDDDEKNIKAMLEVVENA